MQLAAGAEVGPYTVERLLGRGGMGAVYAAVERATGRRVALKVTHQQVTGVLAERFVTEARTAARVRHPNVVAVHDAGVDRGRRWLSMELVEGEALDQRLRSRGPLEPAVAARLALDLARALAHAHALGVVHRDLKPANVLLTHDGRPLLGDFGLAKDLERRDALTRTGELLGTPAYMAPEQLDSTGVGPAADVYGLGATLFALLTGEPPFQTESVVSLLAQVTQKAAPPPSSLRPGLPPALDALCLRCLQKEPADRFPSMEALADALDRFLAGGGGPPPRRAGRALAAGGLALAVIGAGVGVALRAAPGPVDSPPPEVATVASATVEPAPATSGPRLRPRPRWSWKRRDVDGLPARTILERTTVYDPARGVVVLFGGRGETGAFQADLWSWDGLRAACLDAGEGVPTGVDGPGLAVDAARHALLLHGGVRTSVPLETTFRWAGAWERVDALGPGPRGGSALVWSPRAGRVLLFGGFGYDGVGLGDLWSWDGRRFEERPVPGGPPARCYASVTWDRRRQVLVVFGGTDTAGQAKRYTDLWELDGDVWRERRRPRDGDWPPETPPTAMTNDGDRSLLFLAGVLWAWNGEVWERTPLPGPMTKKFGLAWDERRDVGVLVGGERTLGGQPVPELWELRKE